MPFEWKERLVRLRVDRWNRGGAHIGWRWSKPSRICFLLIILKHCGCRDERVLTMMYSSPPIFVA